MDGTVACVKDKGFGFIRAAGESDQLFFHVSDICDDTLAFDETLVERRVRFDIIQGPRGPRATNIRAAS